ncbi:MAG: flagellar hook-associated protein FlgK [Phyllobacterium sp.]
MSLSSALLTAKGSLSATASQTSLISKNIAGSKDPDYVRRIGSLTTTSGGVYMSVQRSADEALLSKYIQTNSIANATNTTTSGLDRLSSLYSANEYSGSPQALMEDFLASLQTYATQPGNQSTGDVAVDKAVVLADALNRGNAEIQKLRADADADIAASVTQLNNLLAKFEEVNNKVVATTAAGGDASDMLDQRDALLKQISSEIGISTLSRGNNDMVIFAENGVTLFEKTARKVSFDPSGPLAAGTTGNAVYIDGVPLGHGTFPQPFGSGSLSGLLQLRDQIAPAYQSQLDETARALVNMFAEQGVPGLFTYSASAGTPDFDDGTIINGIAGTIKVSSDYITSAGGTPDKLRDGGENINGDAGFSERLQFLIGSFDQKRGFDVGAGAGTDLSILDYGAASTSWLESKRQSATVSSEYNMVLWTRAGEALANATGVNVDDEMAKLLELEQSYQASSRIIAAVDAMLAELLEAVR